MALVKLNNNGIKNATAFGSIAGLGNLVLIKTVTLASAAASISFVDGTSSVVLDDTYKEYIFYFNNIHPASDSNFTFNLSADTGSNYNVTKTSTVFGAYHREDAADTVLNYGGGSDLAQSTAYQNMLFGGSMGANDADRCFSGYLHLFEPSSTTFVKHFIGVNNFVDTTSTAYTVQSLIAGYANTTSAIDAIDFKLSTGNIDAGSISLYGVN